MKQRPSPAPRTALPHRALLWGAGAADGPGALAAFLYGARSGGRVIALAGASAEAAAAHCLHAKTFNIISPQIELCELA